MNSGSGNVIGNFMPFLKIPQDKGK